jgi:hypothetical protein
MKKLRENYVVYLANLASVKIKKQNWQIESCEAYFGIEEFPFHTQTTGLEF